MIFKSVLISALLLSILSAEIFVVNKNIELKRIKNNSEYFFNSVCYQVKGE